MDSTPAPDSTPDSITEATLKSMVGLDDLATSAKQLTAMKLKVKGTGNPYLLAHLLSHLGHLQTRQGLFEHARDTLNEADYVLIEAAQRDTQESVQRYRAWLRYMLERARFFCLTGWEPSARTMADEALEMARGTGQFDLFQEIHQLRVLLGASHEPLAEAASSSTATD
jgi:hypothetical protein